MPLGALGILGIVGGATAAGGAAASIYGANKQASAADQAAQLQYKASQDALNFQKQEFATTQANEAPFLKAGQGAVTNLASLLAPGGALTQQWNKQFTAPTAAQAAATPGYQFALGQGQQAIQRSAAAQGGVLSGGTLKALDQYSQGLADSNYQNVYNNALTQYQQSYNQFQQGQANQYNRLAGLAGTGQVAAGQLGSAGQAAAGNVGNILLGSAGQIGGDIQNAAAARASGYAGAANSISGGANSIGQLALLKSLLNNPTAGAATQAPLDSLSL